MCKTRYTELMSTQKKSQATKKAPKAPAARKKTTRAKVTVPARVDIYPNRMTFAAAALAGTVLVLFAVIAVVNP